MTLQDVLEIVAWRARTAVTFVDWSLVFIALQEVE